MRVAKGCRSPCLLTAQPTFPLISLVRFHTLFHAFSRLVSFECFRRSLLVLVLFLAASLDAHSSLHPVALRAENQSNPIALDTPAPRLSWQLESKQRGERQSAYEIQAASSKELLLRGKPDLWDAGKVLSSESIQI